MKKLLLGVAAIAVVIVVAVLLVLGNIDKIVKGVLEETGSQLLGTRVGVAAVDIDLKRGAGQISGLSIANPAGYSSARAFEMDMIRLELNLATLSEQPLVVRELKIQAPVVHLEVREDGSANLQTLLDNIETHSAKAERKPGPEGASKGESVRISIKKLAVTGVTVHASIPGQERETVVLPDIVMENVGREKGLTPEEIGSVIIGEVITESLQATLEKKMTKKIKEAAEGFLGDLKKKFVPEKSE